MFKDLTTTHRRLLGVAIVLGLALMVILGRSPKPSGHIPGYVPPANREIATIPYMVVETWDIRRWPGDATIGHGRAIVIDSRYRNEAALRRLGQQLHDEPSRDEQMRVEVFDDGLSAMRRDQGMVDGLPPKKQRRFDRHLVGTYDRNRQLRSESWAFGPVRMDSQLIVVRYNP
jgi:hypothetical protein